MAISRRVLAGSALAVLMAGSTTPHFSVPSEPFEKEIILDGDALGLTQEPTAYEVAAIRQTSLQSLALSKTALEATNAMVDKTHDDMQLYYAAQPSYMNQTAAIAAQHSQVNYMRDKMKNLISALMPFAPVKLSSVRDLPLAAGDEKLTLGSTIIDGMKSDIELMDDGMISSDVFMSEMERYATFVQYIFTHNPAMRTADAKSAFDTVTQSFADIGQPLRRFPDNDVRIATLTPAPD